MADSENWDGRAWGTSTSRKFSEVIDNRPLRIRTVGGVEGAEEMKNLLALLLFLIPEAP